jgi:integrase
LYKYRLLFQRLQTFAQGRGLRLIKELSVEALREFRITWPLRNTAACKTLEELRAFFGFCQDSGWVASNPAKSLKPPRCTDAPTEPFTDDEVKKILAACAVHSESAGKGMREMETFVEVMLYTGLRIRDSVTLRRDCVAEGKLRLRTEKTGTVVCCPLPPSLIEKLEAIRGTSSQYFFWSGTSNPKSRVGNFQRSLKKLFRLAGVSGGHAHRFRHTFAKRLLMKGVPPDRVAILMGHRNPSITLKHYAAWVKDRQDQLESDVRRAWREETHPEEPSESPKRPEPAIQALYKNQPDRSKWAN